MNNGDTRKLDIALSFKSNLMGIIDDLINMTQCIIPVDTKDKKVLTEGLDKLEDFKKNLEGANSLLELSRLFDVDKVATDYDAVKREICNTTTYVNFCKFMDKIESAVDDGGGDD